ncbi:hypothetical protein FO439_09060 [Weissella cibaria]|uniref:Uncharacterized protein n=1 Tax=Weissella cibaria TaxID=137591 RepID=A0A9Q8N9Q8_9LACO|nr:hypothetical protein [Weissella cibaria]QDG80680.1 hypothetical protein Wei3612_04555 [Weissella cibaria]TVV28046.1 hypothetical protein FO435_09235 [Weissella cibaria]TVV36687.1 hypothetical protein FO439_09060 [Weissella cibaria]TVV41238.1 hypothetical protein FO438_09065 [Weissella cibaria]UNW39393.1 hypothetical protein HUW87_03540 [Weissella cibaria]
MREIKEKSAAETRELYLSANPNAVFQSIFEQLTGLFRDAIQQRDWQQLQDFLQTYLTFHKPLTHNQSEAIAAACQIPNRLVLTNVTHVTLQKSRPSQSREVAQIQYQEATDNFVVTFNDTVYTTLNVQQQLSWDELANLEVLVDGATADSPLDMDWR